MDDDLDMEAAETLCPAPTTCPRCGITTDRYHLRGVAGCSHGPECCAPAPQYEELIARAARTLVREVEEALCDS